jgi:flagellar export protein FliJ
MPFRFPLQAVFHLRQNLEHQQELRLRAANQLVARVQQLIERCDARLEQACAQQSRDLSGGTTSAELHFALLGQAALTRQRQEAERELTRLEKLRDEQQRIFQQARRQRETLEALRNAQSREYTRESARREQRNLDDLFLLRRDYRRRG